MAKLTELEITTLCAAAMGLKVERAYANYNPLHDDAQAFLLVKKFHLHIDQRPGKQISVQDPEFAEMICLDAHKGHALDLNAAICECVAIMQKKRKT